MKACVPVYIVYHYDMVCNVGMPEVWGVFSRYSVAKEELIRYAQNEGISNEDIEDYIEDNFSIEEFFIDDKLKVRGE